MRITTWNVDKGLRPNQVPILEQAEPDIVALQEVSLSHHAFMRAALGHLGMAFMEHTLSDESRRSSGVLLASRWPLERIDPPGPALPYMERALGALIEAPAGTIEVLTVHVPPGMTKVNGRANPGAKIETFQGLAEYYRRPSTHGQILCGDFNTPEEEYESGTVAFFGAKHQAQVEREFHHVVTSEALRDAFRSLHGYGVHANSWLNKARRQTSSPRRFDHVFASPSFRPVEAEYAPEEKVWGAGLSDHLPLTVTLELR